MSHNRTNSFGDGEGMPIQNVEFSTATKPEEEDGAASRARWMQHQQQLQQQHQQQHPMYHGRNLSGSSIDSDAAAEYWQQWQQYYAAYGYSFPAGGYQGYDRYQQQQQLPNAQQPQQQQQAPQGFLIPPQGQQYIPWPATTAGYSVPMSQRTSSRPAATPHSPGHPSQSRKSNTAPLSPKLTARTQQQQQSSAPEYTISPDAEEDKDVYAALLQGGVGPTGYGSTHRKTNSRGSLTDSVGPRTSASGSTSKALLEQPPPPPPRRLATEPSTNHHHRSHSDSLFGSNRVLRRSNTGSSSTGLPRQRTNSRGQSLTRTHRRTSSYASSGGVSVSSMVSIVSDIRRSTFYQEHQAKTSGRVQLHFPNSYVHLAPSRSRKLRLYQVPVSSEQYEAYHRVADESFSWIGDDDEDVVVNGDDDDDVDSNNADFDLEYSSPTSKKKRCTCDCPACVTCQHKVRSALEPNYFLLTVPDNLYRSVVDEICASRDMPCGLFFCGHHEDVSRPSIGIAWVLVLVLFGAMAYAAYVLQG